MHFLWVQQWCSNMSEWQDLICCIAIRGEEWRRFAMIYCKLSNNGRSDTIGHEYSAIKLDHSQTRTLSVIINPKNSKEFWRVQPINNSILGLRTLIISIYMRLVAMDSAPWETINTLCRQRPRFVTEKAKRMVVMIKKGKWMGLRRVPPLSEKMSHRRHTRNEVKYTPVKSACKVVAMVNALMTDNIWSTTATCNLTRMFILLWPVQLWNENITIMTSDSSLSMTAQDFMILWSQLICKSVISDGSTAG